MAIRYYIDPETDLPHIYKHGIREHEVEWVLDAPDDDRVSRNNTRQAVGMTEAGRAIIVIYRELETATLVISARELQGKDLRAYRRLLRRKPVRRRRR